MELYQVLSLVGIPALASAILGLIIKRPLEKKIEANEEQNLETQKQNKAIMLGVQALLRDRLLQGYRYFSDRGWADYDSRQNMENLYQQYHSLGQNGVMDDMRRRFLELPIDKPVEKAG